MSFIHRFSSAAAFFFFFFNVGNIVIHATTQPMQDIGIKVNLCVVWHFSVKEKKKYDE